MPQFESESGLLFCRPESLRAFLGRTENLPLISNPDLELEILAAPEEVTQGERIEFRLTAWGFKQRATNEYVVVSDICIEECQIDGPLRAWRHVQIIDRIDDSQCRLRDRVEFEPPGGMLGFLLTEDRICESLREGMGFRYETLQELIRSGTLR